MKNLSRRIHEHPENSSTSKHQYSFSRGKRFESTAVSPCRTSFYNLKSYRGTRTTSFGIGDKLTFESKEKVPAPGSYKLGSMFGGQRGWSVPSTGKPSPIDEVKEKKQPGPGAYLALGTQKKFPSISYSFRSKYLDPLTMHLNELGPGHYNLSPSINPQGIYYNSKFRSSGCNRMGKSMRFQNDKDAVPGPGAYKSSQINSINEVGSYYDSKFRSSGASFFDRSNRPSQVLPSAAPGPGAYPRFSTFQAFRPSI